MKNKCKTFQLILRHAGKMPTCELEIKHESLLTFNVFRVTEILKCYCAIFHKQRDSTFESDAARNGRNF